MCMCTFCCPTFTLIDLCILPIGLKLFGEKGSTNSQPAPLKKPWIIITMGILCIGLGLYLRLCVKCSRLVGSSFLGISPIAYSGTPCFSEDAGNYAFDGIATSVFLSVGFVMGLITLYYMKFGGGGYNMNTRNGQHKYSKVVDYGQI